jgi:glycolate oxidase iron-sulfur subunit
MDSPRGRVYLMKAGAEGRISLTDGVTAHFDTCLGCMACETACPSGVRYAPLIEATRAVIEDGFRRSRTDRLFRALLFSVLPYPYRLRLLALPLALVRLVGRSRLAAILPRRGLFALAPSVPLRETLHDVPERTAAMGERRLRTGLVTGCVQRVFFGRVNDATRRVLAAEGCEVIAPSRQGCCGALALHAGRAGEARALARDLIAAFDAAGVEQIVVNAAGCGSALKEYGELLKDDPAWAERATRFAAKVRDVSETLAGLDAPRARRQPITMRAAYHDACHLAHAQGVRREPRAVLESVPGLTLVPIPEADICCGSAGIFNLVEPEMGAELGARKARNILDAKPDAVVTSNPGCMLQIAAATRVEGRPTPVFHVVELIEASIDGVSAEQLIVGHTERMGR